jgi:hypothetical protein
MTLTTVLVIAVVVILGGILVFALAWMARGYNHPI